MRETETIWMNGEFIDWQDAKVHVGVHGLHYGTGVFEGIRCYETPDGPAFALRFEPVPDAAEGVAALNAAVERVARRDPAQYQWTYKRWSIPAPDSPLGNPYWPDCYAPDEPGASSSPDQGNP